MSSTTNSALKRVSTVLYVNLAISLVLAALTFLFKNSILDYQLSGVPGIGESTPAQVTGDREALSAVLWIRPLSVLIVSVVYLRLANRLHLGKRSTYLRVLIIAVLGFLGLGYLVATAQFPVWMQVGQAVQALVLLGLLFVVTRREVRDHFAETSRSTPSTRSVSLSAHQSLSSKQSPRQSKLSSIKPSSIKSWESTRVEW